jgi:hypothetical protein
VSGLSRPQRMLRDARHLCEACGHGGVSVVDVAAVESIRILSGIDAGPLSSAFAADAMRRPGRYDRQTIHSYGEIHRWTSAIS